MITWPYATDDQGFCVPYAHLSKATELKQSRCIKEEIGMMVKKASQYGNIHISIGLVSQLISSKRVQKKKSLQKYYQTDRKIGNTFLSGGPSFSGTISWIAISTSAGVSAGPV